MSLIYESLQQLNRKRHQARHGLQVQNELQSTRHNRLLATAGLGIALLFVLSGLGYVLMKSSLSAPRVSTPARPEQQSPPESPQHLRGKGMVEASSNSPHLLRASKLFTPQAKSLGKSTQEKPQATHPAGAMSSDRKEQKIKRPETSDSTPIRAELQVAPDSTAKSHPKAADLQSHFQNQIKKNQNIRQIESKIKNALKEDSLKKARQHLKTLIEVVGDAENVTAIRWKAVLAMAENKLKQAEELFMQARALDPGNVETNVNLILCCRAQGLHDRARRIYEELSRDHPFHPSVKQLENSF